MSHTIKVKGLSRRRPEEIEALLSMHGVKFTLIHTKPVYTCHEAAMARSVPLHNELKTLLVVYRDNLALLNLPGDRRINRRCVRHALSAHEFRLANVNEMASLQLTRGIISPLSLVGCRSLVDSEVLSLEWITTNAGSLTTGIKVGVQALLGLCNLEIANLSSFSMDYSRRGMAGYV
jgi:prolyl-tRNA editing enzyme YbaK/EbsC (Cys-tRNA(Pro) deacylase)